MMDNTEHDHIIENLPAYSLGILEAELLSSVEEHLATCDSCSAELARLNATTLALAFSAPDVTPPAGARERFAQMLAAEITNPSTVAEASVTPLVPSYKAPVAAPVQPVYTPAPRQTVADPQEPKRRWWELFSPAAWTLSGALAVALILVAVWSVGQNAEIDRLQATNTTTQQQVAQLQGQLTEQQNQVAQLQGQLTEQQNQVAQLQGQLTEQQSQFAQLQEERQLAVQVLGNPDVKAYTLLATGADGSVARLWVDEATNNAMLVTRNLAPAPDGKVYELWFIDEAPRAIEIFNTDTSGIGVVSFQLPASFSGYNIAAITVETGRVEAPTTNPILATEL